MAKKESRQSKIPHTDKEEIPPGATTRASHRAIHQGGGAPGSGAGPRHAADDPGSPNEEYGAVDSNSPLADGTLIDQDAPLEEEEPEAYGGFHGGAVGGTPAQGRAIGGHLNHGIPAGTDRHPDTTIGAKPKNSGD